MHSLITDARYNGYALQCTCRIKEKGFVTGRPWRDQASQCVLNRSHSTLERIEEMNIYKGKKERVEGPGLNHLSHSARDEGKSLNTLIKNRGTGDLSRSTGHISQSWFC